MKLHHTLLMVLAIATVIAAFSIIGTHIVRARLAEFPEQKPVDWSSVRDDPARQMEISWLGSTSFAGAREGSYIETLLEDEYNIQLDPIFMDPNAYMKKKGLMYAGGNVPDVCLDAQMQTDIRHGFVLEIPYEVLEEHAPHWVAEVNRTAPNAWLPMHANGKNYGLPTIYLNGVRPAPGIWRADWLEAVGIESVPDTLDEMYEALHRFTHDDPDGNGRDDTYGMSNDIQAFWWTSFAEIFGAHGVLPFDWMERDGRIVWGGLLPETRQALALLRDWYAAGVIDPEFVTDRSNTPGGLQHKFLNGRTGYLYYAGRFENLDRSRENSMINKLIKLNPDARVAVGRFPAGPQGHRGARVHGPDGGGGMSFARDLANDPAKVLRVLKMLDRMIAEEDFHLRAKAGKRGEHWQYRDPEVGPNSGIEYLPPYDQGHRARLEVLSLFLEGASFFNTTSAPREIAEKYKPRDELAFNREYRRLEWAMIDILGMPHYVPSAEKYLNDLRMNQLKVFAEIIRGDVPLENFDAWTEDWLRRGGDILTREANQLFETKLKIFRRLGIPEEAAYSAAPIGTGEEAPQ